MAPAPGVRPTSTTTQRPARCQRCGGDRLRVRLDGLNHLLLQLVLVFTAGALVTVIVGFDKPLTVGSFAAVVWWLALRLDRHLVRRAWICTDCRLAVDR